MSRINKILLDKLFIDPKPQPERPEVLELFKKLSYRMFPGKEDFKGFLTTHNIDKQYMLSEKIIHHLCFVSNFPPTYFAMTDVLSVENFQKQAYTEADVRSSFIPRDHFIHLVNLYILGIYIFFYNSDFFNRIIKENQFQRVNEMVLQPYIAEIKDFISEWRYFVLYHDIGYVPEIFSNDTKIVDAAEVYKMLNTSSTDFQSSLSKGVPLKQTSFFGAIEIMAKIFTAQFILKNSTKKINGKSKCFREFKKSGLIDTSLKEADKLVDFDEVIEPELTQETVYLEKIYTNSCLKYILPIYGDDNVVVLGIAKQTGELAYVSLVGGNIRKLIVNERYQSDTEVQKLVRYPQLLLYDDYRSVNYEHDFLLKKDNAEDAFVYLMLFKDEDISYAFDYLDNELSVKFAGITSEEQLFDFCYEVYLFIYKLIRRYISPGKEPQNSKEASDYNVFINSWDCSLNKMNEKYFNDSIKLQKIVYSVIKGSFSKEIEKACLRQFHFDLSEKKKIEDLENVNSTIEQIVKGYVKELKKTLNSDEEIERVIAKIKEYYSQKMEQIASILKVYSYIYARLKYIFEDKAGFNYSFSYETRHEESEDSFCSVFIDRKKGEETYKKIIDDYEIPYGNTINHGFASTKYTAAMFSLFRNSIERKDKCSLDCKLIDIYFDILNSEKNKIYLDKYVKDYDNIFENVLYAILIHDVYPDKFKKESTYFKMSTPITDTFTYLALLSDALQDWNRPQLLNAPLLDLKVYDHASDSYNIDVSNRGIYLYEEGKEASQKRLEKLIANMNHLKNIKARVKDGYVEA